MVIEVIDEIVFGVIDDVDDVEVVAAVGETEVIHYIENDEIAEMVDVDEAHYDECIDYW